MDIEIGEEEVENGIIIEQEIRAELEVELDVAKRILSSETGHRKLICEDLFLKEEKQEAEEEMWLKEEANKVVKIKGNLCDLAKSIK